MRINAKDEILLFLNQIDNVSVKCADIKLMHYNNDHILLTTDRILLKAEYDSLDFAAFINKFNFSYDNLSTEFLICGTIWFNDGIYYAYRTEIDGIGNSWKLAILPSIPEELLNIKQSSIVKQIDLKDISALALINEILMRNKEVLKSLIYEIVYEDKLNFKEIMTEYFNAITRKKLKKDTVPQN